MAFTKANIINVMQNCCTIVAKENQSLPKVSGSPGLAEEEKHFHKQDSAPLTADCYKAVNFSWYVSGG